MINKANKIELYVHRQIRTVSQIIKGYKEYCLHLSEITI